MTGSNAIVAETVQMPFARLSMNKTHHRLLLKKPMVRCCVLVSSYSLKPLEKCGAFINSSGNLCKYSRTDGPIGVMPNTLPYCPTFVSVLSNPASAWQESRRNFWSDSDE